MTWAFVNLPPIVEDLRADGNRKHLCRTRHSLVEAHIQLTGAHEIGPGANEPVLVAGKCVRGVSAEQRA